MRFRRVPPKVVVEPFISAIKAGLPLNVDHLETHYLAGGDVNKVVMALISAEKAGIALDFKRAASIDLAGRDVLEAVKMSVNPKVINTPVVAAVAKDGIQVKALSRVTVRANIDRLVGGAGEETILARVGEGIVTTIGSAETHKKVLENPDTISKTVLDKGSIRAPLSRSCRSISPTSMSARTSAPSCRPTRRKLTSGVAQARAEGRRAMAVAEEQEMSARAQEMRAKLIEAESQVPLAMADAFRQGNMGIMDYYRMKNVQADTDMRESISDQTGGKTPGSDTPST